MNEQIKTHMEKYPKEVSDLFCKLRQIIFKSTACDLNETLWAKIPSYYLGDSFVRLIPFKDHINIEAKEIIKYKDELSGYKITPKGMLQIYLGQDIPTGVLKMIFSETLTGL